jgi:hypothetical protein
MGASIPEPHDMSLQQIDLVLKQRIIPGKRWQKIQIAHDMSFAQRLALPYIEKHCLDDLRMSHHTFKFDHILTPWEKRLARMLATYQQGMISATAGYPDQFTIAGHPDVISLFHLCFAFTSTIVEQTVREGWRTEWQEFQTLHDYRVGITEQALNWGQSALSATYFRWRVQVAEAVDAYDTALIAYVDEMLPKAPRVNRKRLRSRSGGYVFGLNLSSNHTPAHFVFPPNPSNVG